MEVSEPSEFGVWLVGVGPEVHGSDGNSPFPRYSGLMNAQRPQFDSHRFVKRLTTAGLSEEVAEILADEHTRLIIPDDVATKADVQAVSANLDFARAEMATKADLETIKAEMATKADLHSEITASEARMEQRLQNAILDAKISLIKWMIATMAVFSGIVIGAMTAFQ